MNPTIKNPSDDYCPWEEELRKTVRQEYFSEVGRKQKDRLNPDLLRMVEDFISGKDVSRFDYLQEWTKPATEHWGIDLQTYFNDEYLKEIGLYDSAVEAREAYERNFDPEEDARFEAERDRLNYLKAYEDNNHLHIRKRLKPSLHQEIIDYLYNGGTAPKRMDCWDAPIAWLKERGMAEEIIKEDFLKD